MTPAPLQASRLHIEQRDGPLAKMPPKETLKFGATFTDHMMEVDWDITNGWQSPQIKPFQNLSLHPASTSLHYGLQVFEGMKAFRSQTDGKVRLFRPDMNAERMKKSCERITLPSFDTGELVELIKRLVKLDEKWVPEGEGYALYIRPTCISTEDKVGVGAPTKAKLFVLLSPVGPYFGTGFKPIQLLADTSHVRAFPGGGGDCKLGGNYAPTILPQREAAAKGFSNILWLLPEGDDFQVTECGAMNFLVVWKNSNGQKELVTPPISSNLILPGVTRDSVLVLAREMSDLTVSEKPVYMKKDIIKALSEGRLLEMMCCGTAATVCSVNKLHFEHKDYDIPAGGEIGAGPVTLALRKQLQDIQYGVVPHKWNLELSSDARIPHTGG